MQYFKTVLEEKNPGKMWREIKRIFPNKTTKHEVTPEISVDEFNDYFINIGRSVTSQFTANLNPDILWKGPVSQYRFSFYTVTSQKVLKYLKMLPDRSYTDVIGIDAKLLKLGAPELSLSLTHIFNLSMTQSVIPPDWKIARVSPIYKK